MRCWSHYFCDVIPAPEEYLRVRKLTLLAADLEVSRFVAL